MGEEGSCEGLKIVLVACRSVTVRNNEVAGYAGGAGRSGVFGQLGALLMLIPLNVWIPVAMSGMLIEDKTHTRT